MIDLFAGLAQMNEEAMLDTLLDWAGDAYVEEAKLAADVNAMVFEYEGMPGHVMLQTTTFDERDGSTQVRVVASFQSVADRDGMVASGMERGVRDGDERLDELLATLQAS